jgi:alpha-N-acetylglucosamine transferase
MFKNRHFEVKFVKDSKAPAEEISTPLVNPEELSRIAKEIVKYTAIAGIVVMGASVVLNTLSEIAVIAADSKINEKD